MTNANRAHSKVTFTNVWWRQVENLVNNIFHAIGTRHVDVFAAVRPHFAGHECSGDDCGACKVRSIIVLHFSADRAKRLV